MGCILIPFHTFIMLIKGYSSKMIAVNRLGVLEFSLQTELKCMENILKS